MGSMTPGSHWAYQVVLLVELATNVLQTLSHEVHLDFWRAMTG